MCGMCLRSPCDTRCPNAPEAKIIYTCSKCGYGIFEGEKFLDGPEGYICEECLADMTVKEILEMCGENLRTA